MPYGYSGTIHAECVALPAHQAFMAESDTPLFHFFSFKLPAPSYARQRPNDVPDIIGRIISFADHRPATVSQKRKIR